MVKVLNKHHDGYCIELCFSLTASSIASLNAELNQQSNQNVNLSFGPSIEPESLFARSTSQEVFLDSRGFYRVHGPAAFRSSVISPNLDVPNTYNYTILLFWFFFFSSCITIFFLVYFFTAISQNTELRRPVRETRGFSRAQVGDAMTAVIPLTWSISMLMHASLFSTNFDDNVAATTFSFTVIAYQWGWNYYFPKDITSLADCAPVLVGRGRVSPENSAYGYESLMAKTKDEYLARVTSQGAYVNPTSKFTVAQLFDLFMRSSQPSFSAKSPLILLSSVSDAFLVKGGQPAWASLFSRFAEHGTLETHKGSVLSGFPFHNRSFSGLEGLSRGGFNVVTSVSRLFFNPASEELKNFILTSSWLPQIPTKLKLFNLTPTPTSSLHPWGQRTKKNFSITSNRLTSIYKTLSSSKYTGLPFNASSAHSSYIRTLLNSDKITLTGSLQAQEAVVQPITFANVLVNLNQVPGPWTKKEGLAWVSTLGFTGYPNKTPPYHLSGLKPRLDGYLSTPLPLTKQSTLPHSNSLHTPELLYTDDLDVSFYTSPGGFNLEKGVFVNFYKFSEKFSLLWRAGFPQQTDLGLGKRASLVPQLAELNSGAGSADFGLNLGLNLSKPQNQALRTPLVKLDLARPFFSRQGFYYPLEQQTKWSEDFKSRATFSNNGVFPWIQGQFLFKNASFLSQGPNLYALFGLNQNSKNYLSFLTPDLFGAPGFFDRGGFDLNWFKQGLSYSRFNKIKTNLKGLLGTSMTPINSTAKPDYFTTGGPRLVTLVTKLVVPNHVSSKPNKKDLVVYCTGDPVLRQLTKGYNFFLPSPSNFTIQPQAKNFFNFNFKGLEESFFNLKQLEVVNNGPAAEWLNAEDRKKVQITQNLEAFDPLKPYVPSLGQAIGRPVFQQPELFVWRWSWAPQVMCADLPIENFFRGSIVRRPTKGFWEQSNSNERALYKNALAFSKKRFDKASTDLLISKSFVLTNKPTFGELGLPSVTSAKKAIAEVPLRVLPSPHLDLDFMFLFAKWSWPLNVTKRENHDSRFKVLWGPLFAAYHLDFKPFKNKLTQAPTPVDSFSGPDVTKALPAKLQSFVSLANQLKLNDNYSDLGLGLKKNTIKLMPLLQGAKGYSLGSACENEKLVYQAANITSNLNFSRFWDAHFNSFGTSPHSPTPNKWALMWFFDFGSVFRSERGRGEMATLSRADVLFSGLSQRRLNYWKTNFWPLEYSTQEKSFSKINASVHLNSQKSSSKASKRSGFVPLSEELHQSRRLRVSKGVFLPADIPMHGIFGSKDVVHSWAIPGLHIKIDCIPGYSSQRRIYINTRGLFWGQCMEVCGRYHHWMPILIRTGHLDLFLWWCAHHLSGLEQSFLTSSQPLVSPELSSAWVWGLVSNPQNKKSFFFDTLLSF